MKRPLIHVIYASVAAVSPTAAELERILLQSRRNNERAGVTGMLVYADASFFQVLEGEVDPVEQTLARIAADPRHSGLVTVIRERIFRRAFGAWTMGFVADTPNEAAALAGANDFFADASCWNQLNDGRAKRLLATFRAGRWRTGEATRNQVAVRRIA
ncbi:MAG: BLUF domain-containing protein [Gemmatimonadaceae bacterium]